jgi:hypothetical protein
MHTPAEPPPAADGTRGLGAAVADVRERVKTLAGLEVELATLELRRKLAALGLGVGLFVAAALLTLYGLLFLFATIAAALATFLDTWLALLIVTLFLLLVAAILVLAGRSSVRRGTPPLPEQAIEEARLTQEALKGDGAAA